MAAKRKRAGGSQANRITRLYGKGGGGGGSGANGAKSSSSYNPFDYKHGTHRFDVLGKTTTQRNNSGSGNKNKNKNKRKVSVKHDEGIRKRERSLLVEYNRRFNANTFLDRRFGEGDETLNEEDKAILRFQRERIKQQKQSRFALQDDPDEFGGDGMGEGEEALTHLGRNLDDFDEADLRGEEDQNEADFGFISKRGRAAGGVMNDQEFENMMTEFQFGNQRGGADGDEDGEDGEDGEGNKKKKSKKEVMQELIAKSKYFKGLKAKEKDEDEALRSKLDDEFKQIMQDADTMASLARLRQARKDQNLRDREGTRGGGRRDFHERKSEADANYDKVTDELVWDFRQNGAQAMPTREEIARRAKQKLEEMEKERVKMLQGDRDEGVLEDEDPDKMKGFRGRRMRHKLAEEEAEGGAKGYEERLRRKRSAMEETGDDLGDDFALSGDESEDDILYHGEGAKSEDDSSDYYSESEDKAEGSSDEEEEEEEEDELSEGINEEDDDDVKETGGKASRKSLDEKAKLARGPAQADITTAQNGKKSKGEEEKKKKKKSGKGSKFEELPYVIPIPKSYKEFADLVEDLEPKEKVEILQRIRISSPVSLGPENRKSMQVFYGILIQFFVNQCKISPLPMDTINALVPEIHTLASEVPLYAATVARARLDQMHKCVLRGMWPTKQMLGTLQLFTELFDAQQPRHPVLTPMLLVISKWLLFTPIQSGEDLAKGLYLVKILFKYIEHSKVLIPECLQFLNSITKRVKVDSTEPGLLALPVKTKVVEKSLKKAVAVDDIVQVESGGVDGNDIFDSVSFKISALTNVYELLVDLYEIYSKLPSASEMFEPIVARMKTLASDFAGSSYAKQGKGLQKHVESLEKGLLESIANRPSLGNAFKEPVKAVKQFNPRFEENFVQGKDYDIDRDRSERKRLRRELKREKRGAMRELRKDNKFLTTIKNKEETQTKDAVQSKYNQMFHFLQQQESDFRSGGQKTLGKFKKKQS